MPRPRPSGEEESETGSRKERPGYTLLLPQNGFSRCFWRSWRIEPSSGEVLRGSGVRRLVHLTVQRALWLTGLNFVPADVLKP